MPKTGKRYIEHLNVRVPTSEMELLRQYCQDTHRTQSDVIREFIRSLKPTVPQQDAPEKPR
ncbi:ribbon-helix-helix protein, CopG family [Egbenema bharatensis]|uniref:ribbon-helix-helix protein, CopG family n=1 Tax=Egbenema bharatensis TaxID=3463334 RepID=UPI003A857C5F